MAYGRWESPLGRLRERLGGLDAASPGRPCWPPVALDGGICLAVGRTGLSVVAGGDHGRLERIPVVPHRRTPSLYPGRGQQVGISRGLPRLPEAPRGCPISSGAARGFPRPLGFVQDLRGLLRAHAALRSSWEVPKACRDHLRELGEARRRLESWREQQKLLRLGGVPVWFTLHFQVWVRLTEASEAAPATLGTLGEPTTCWMTTRELVRTHRALNYCR